MNPVMNEIQNATVEHFQKAGYAADYASRLATRLPVGEHIRIQKLSREQLREEVDQIERDRYEARAICARGLRITTGRAQDLVEQLNDAEVSRILAAAGKRHRVKDVLAEAHDRRVAEANAAEEKAKPKKKAGGKPKPKEADEKAKPKEDNPAGSPEPENLQAAGFTTTQAPAPPEPAKKPAKKKAPKKKKS